VIEVDLKLIRELDGVFFEPVINEQTFDYLILVDLIPDSDEVYFIHESIYMKVDNWFVQQAKKEFNCFLALEVLPEPDGNHPRRRLTL
jgi:hypothetical protein